MAGNRFSKFAAPSSGSGNRFSRFAMSPEERAASDAKTTMDVPEWIEPARQFVRQATFGASDAIPAGMFAAGTALNKFIGQDRGYSPSQAYQAARAAETQMTKDRESPVNTVAGVAGGLLGPGVALKGLRGASMLAKVGRGAAAGGIMGTASGALNAQSFEEIPGDAATGALTGAAVGGALPTLTPAARTARQVLNSATGGRLIPASQGAVRRLQDAMRRDGVLPEQARRIIQEWTATGATPPALADVAGENTRALLRNAASKQGPGRTQAVQYAQETAENLQGRAIDRARRLTQDGRPAGEVRAALERDQGAVSDRLYPEFQGDMVPVGDDITSALSGTTGTAIMRGARRIADARRDTQVLRELDALARGEATHVSAGALDLLRRGIRDNVDVAQRAGQNTVAGGLRGRQSDIELALDEVPGAVTARNVHRHYAQRIEAIDQGGAILGDTPDEFAGAVGQMDREMLDAARVGARQAITDALGQPANASPVLRRIGFAENARRNLSALFGEEEAARYVAAARNELTKRDNANFISPNTGSQTQLRGSDDRSAAQVIDGIVQAVRRPVAATTNFFLRGEGPMTEAERAEVVRLGLQQADQAAPGVFTVPRQSRFSQYAEDQAIAGATRAAVPATNAFLFGR